MLTAMKATKSSRRWLSVVALGLALLAVGAFALSPGALAKGPPPGKGGGGNTTPPPPYSFTDLGGFTGRSYVQSRALGISNVDLNGLAVVVGDSPAPDGDSHAAVWDVSAAGDVLGLSEILPLDGVIDNVASAVNDAGIVVGNTSLSGAVDSDGDYVFPAFVAVPAHPISELPTFGKRRAQARGINNLGDIAGSAWDAANVAHGALWNVDGDGTITGPIDLGDFVPRDINDGGVMAGEQNNAAAIAWFDNQSQLVVQTIGSLSATGPGRAYAINNLNEVVGTSNGRAFYWSVDTGMLPLGDFGGGYSDAFDINDSGQVVGTAETGKQQHPPSAFLWENGVLIDLNTQFSSDASWWLTDAYSINNSGQIVGRGNYYITPRNREVHGYLLTPNP